MGPRSASMRHINVDMAPALTESSQSHEFVLPAKHKPLLTLHFAPSVLSKPMDDFTSPEPEVINGLSFSAFKFTHVDKCKAVRENADGIKMNGNGDRDLINLTMGHTDEHKIENDMDQLLKNVPKSFLDVIKEAIGPEASTEEYQQPLPIPQNSDDKFVNTLFDNVDVATICEEETGSIAVDTTNKTVPEDAVQSKIESLLKKKALIEERHKTLLERACRIHTRLIGTHASSEINLVLECISQSYLYDTADISVRRLVEALDNNIQQHQTILIPANSYFGSAAIDKTDLKAPVSLVKLNPEYQKTLEEVPGHLQTQLKAVQSYVDSDATASSSEAESCDETQSFSNSHQLGLPIGKRAAWRWNRDRSRLGGKWSWLLRQIGDVETRLRDYHHAARKLRCARPPPLASVNVNGLVPPVVAGVPSESEDVCVSCARTRGYDSTAHRKRKVYRLRDLSRVHPKLSAPVPVRCRCIPPLPPCALCLGRQDPTQPREGLSLDGKQARVAFVDEAYHPNSSFDTDVSRRVHLEAVMCTPWWQSRPQPFSLKQRRLLSDPKLSAHSPQLKKHANSLPVPLSNEVPKMKRKYTKRRKLSLSGGGPDRFTPAGGTGNPPPPPRPSRPKRSSTQQHWNHLLLDEEGEEEPMEEESGEECEEELLVRGVASPCPSHTGKEFRTRRRESSYDIDNIVIPYSVAATTRVEVLQYKEIPTPKWRFIEGGPTSERGAAPPSPPPPPPPCLEESSEEEDEEMMEEVEDLSDEAFMRRHEKYELEERRKFRLPGPLPHAATAASVRRAARRTDSRAESSGANTPDAQSPKHQAGGELGPSTQAPAEGASPLPSPPLFSSSSGDPGPDTTAAALPKRRSLASRSLTVSESSSREENPRCVSPDSIDEVSPYSPLEFPLSDEQYARLLKDMPPGHPTPTMQDRNYSYEDQSAAPPPPPPSPSTAPPPPAPAPSLQVQMPDSPAALMSDSGDSTEDPNDPEWTFESSKPPPSERYHLNRSNKFFEY